jgi:hypothetical protein
MALPQLLLLLCVHGIATTTVVPFGCVAYSRIDWELHGRYIVSFVDSKMIQN